MDRRPRGVRRDRLRLPPPAGVRLRDRRHERRGKAEDEVRAARGGPARAAGRARRRCRTPSRRGALRRPGRVPPGRTCSASPSASRRRRRASSSTRAPSRSTPTSGCLVKTPGGASRPTTSSSRRTSRSSTARWRSPACTPQRSYAIVCRIDGAAARGHVHQRRLADALGARACRSDGEELLLVGGEGHKPGTGRRHRAALRAAGGVRARALGRRAVDVPLVGAGQRRRPTACPTSAALTPLRRPRADGDRLREVGHDGRHGGGDDPRRPRAAAARTRGRRCSTPPASTLRAVAPRFAQGERRGRRCASSATA